MELTAVLSEWALLIHIVVILLVAVVALTDEGLLHVGGHVVTNEGICIATPAWQGLTRHGHKVVPAAKCKPGVDVLDWRGLRDGSLPQIHRRIYEAPKPAAIAV